MTHLIPQGGMTKMIEYHNFSAIILTPLIWILFQGGIGRLTQKPVIFPDAQEGPIGIVSAKRVLVTNAQIIQPSLRKHVMCLE